MRRLVIVIFCLLITPVGAWATVQPPEEWFDSPEKEQQWLDFLPTLLEWEFGEREPIFGTSFEAASGIQQFLGRDDSEIAQDLGIDTDDPEIRRYDRNLDGRVDHFDLLELGYEVQPKTKSTSTAPSTGTNEWIVLRADFPNRVASSTYTISYFNDRLFSDGTASKPSVNDYYKEVSYGALTIDGEISDDGPGGDGWFRADNNWQWYHNNGGGFLVQEAILDADPDVDFSQFDVDGDGFVESLCVYYPGPVQFNGGLHPHRSSGLNIHVDGVIIDSYFLSVVDSNTDSYLMVISAHEYGHILGLPDLYDVNGGSAGVGKWSLMANNYDSGQKPPSPDPWCKIQLGWVTPVLITDNVTGYSLGCFQDNPNVLKVWTNGQEEDQYFLLANYRKKKTDANRPGQGLMIFHIDDTRAGGNMDNADEDHKHVDVESARGYSDPSAQYPKDPLDDGNSGHANDPYFPTNSDSDYTGIFDDTANPFAKKYVGSKSDGTFGFAPTGVSVSNITGPADTITLDIVVVTATAPTCTITIPAASSSQTGDVTVEVTATATGERTIDHVDFFCNKAYLGTDDSSPYSLTFDSRKIYNGTSREIKAIAVDSEDEIDTDTVTVSISNDAVSFPYSENFDSGIEAWAVYDPQGSERWESKTESFSGSHSAGIGGDDGLDYNEHDKLVSVRIDLTGTTHPIARFRHRYRVSSGENTCRVMATDDHGATLDLLKVYTGANLSWHPAAVDLTDYIGEEIHLVFWLDTTSLNTVSGVEGGWWIDELEVKELSTGPSITDIDPDDAETVTGVETITVTATDDEGVVAVEFYINNELYHTEYSAPYQFDWNSDWVFNGTTTFKAIAFDADVQSDTDSVSWTISNPGLALPWGDSFDTEPDSTWHIIDESSLGIWHWRDDEGWDDGPGMRFAIPGYNVHYNNESDWLITPTFNLDSIADGWLLFAHKYDIEDGGVEYDKGWVYVTTDLGTWTELTHYSEEDEPWQIESLDISGYEDEKVKLAWYFESDGGLYLGGWWLDEMIVTTDPLISSTSPTRGAQGMPLTIIGSGFGKAAVRSASSVTLGGTGLAINSWSDTAIEVAIPINATSGNLVVTRDGEASNTYALTIVLPPPSQGGLEQL